MKEITLSFLGGAGEVGKSCYTVEADGFRFMLDCGVKLTEPPTYPKIPANAHALILSHAHLDHSGMVPGVYKMQHIPVYGTDVTFELSHLIQHDSLKVERLSGYPSRYTDADVDELSNGEIPLSYNKPRRISDNATLTLYDAGHIPGSAGVLLSIGDITVFYTGDTNNRETLLMPAGKYPKADVMITESTYGNRNHPNREETMDSFIAAVEETLDGGGVALVPAFGVGRSQEILMALESVSYPIYLDGMAKAATRILLQYPEYLRDPDFLQKVSNGVEWIRDQSERKRIIREPCVIVTTAGMLTGGPVVEYIKRLYKDSKSSIFLTGYQVEGTNGRVLLDEGFIVDEMTHKKYPVKMNVQKFDFSAHADQSGLLDIASKVKPGKIVCVHGDPESGEILKEKLGGKYDVSTPQIGEKISVPVD